MKNKLEVGMYVRIATGFDIKMSKPIIRIGKIEDISDYCITINVFSRLIIVSLKEFEELKRKEPSFNIIDLIEVGDYVNGKKVIDKQYHYTDEDNIDMGEWCIFYENVALGNYQYDIKSIVTKEQFESMSYKVGD